MIAKSCSMGLEGIVSKLANSPYHPGRQESWLKAKCLKRQEFVIIGYTAARKGSRAIGALHLGYNDKGRMKYAGKVGTGFSMKDAQDLYDRLAKLHHRCPSHRRPAAQHPQNRALGEGRAAMRGCLYGMDGRWSHPASFLSRFARR